jgi:hypothetical protein
MSCLRTTILGQKRSVWCPILYMNNLFITYHDLGAVGHLGDLAGAQLAVLQVRRAARTDTLNTTTSRVSEAYIEYRLRSTRLWFDTRSGASGSATHKDTSGTVTTESMLTDPLTASHRPNSPWIWWDMITESMLINQLIALVGGTHREFGGRVDRDEDDVGQAHLRVNVRREEQIPAPTPTRASTSRPFRIITHMDRHLHHHHRPPPPQPPARSRLESPQTCTNHQQAPPNEQESVTTLTGRASP